MLSTSAATTVRIRIAERKSTTSRMGIYVSTNLHRARAELADRQTQNQATHDHLFQGEHGVRCLPK